MTYTERLMANGDWSLTLRPETPRVILNQMSLKKSAFGHIVVTPTYIDLSEMSDADALSHSSFTGVYRRQPSDREFGGMHVNSWPGEDDKRGRSFNGLGVPGSGTFADWRTNIISLLSAGLSIGAGLGPGTVSGTYSQSFFRSSLRSAIEQISTRFGTEWRVTNRFALDWGTPATIFKLTPNALVVRHRADAGRTWDLRAIQGDLDVDRDVDDWVWRIIYSYNNNTATVVANGGIADADVPYRGPGGAPAWIDLVIEDSQTTAAGDANSLAGAQWGRFNPVREELRLTSEEFDIDDAVSVGDAIWVYDPARGIENPANPIEYRGGAVFPVAIRCVGLTRPFRRGQGVWFRRWRDTGTAWEVSWIDLTDYVEWEDARTTVEVGALPRRR